MYNKDFEIMGDKEFVMLLQKAIENDGDALYEIIQMYEPLIKKHSKINGKFNEDVKADIEIHLFIKAIKDFKFDRTKKNRKI